MLRIMIVDDNLATRNMLRDVFEQEGHQIVQETETLEETLAAYAAHRPDFVTMDLSMPDCDGLTLLKALMKMDPKARVLVISANAQVKVRDDVHDAGAAGFLNKPFSIEELLAAAARIQPR